jgi:alkaline phosphatase D
LERQGEDLPLTLNVAADPEFASVVVTREGLLARAAHDGCVKVEVPGLAPGTHYWYRFTYQGSETSPVGRTKTAPAPDQPETVRFAFLNCQDYVGRYYNTLAHLVQREADSLDFIVHLGDYVYETTGDPGFQTPGEGRSLVFGDSEGALDLGGFQAARSLDNYRDLYRIYRSDPVLQRLHELFPVIAIWDDHEFSDDRHGGTATYLDGEKDELDIARLHNSEQAFFEYLPIGIGLDDVGVNVTPAELFPNTRIFRDFHFGAHLHLLLTDYRSFRPDHLIAEDAFPGTIVMEEPVLEDLLGPAWPSLRESLDPYLNIDDPQHAVRKATLLGIIGAAYRAAGLDAAEADQRAAVAVRANLSASYVDRALEAAGQGALALGPETQASLPRGLSYLFLGKQDLLSSFGSRYGVARDTYALYAARFPTPPWRTCKASINSWPTPIC